jgi:hypothetical protein
MKFDVATKLAEQGIDQLAEALGQGRSDTLEAYLSVLAKFHRYSFQNSMLIAFQCPNASHVAGFNAWKKLGRQVVKGAKGIAILAPCVYRSKDDEASDCDKKAVVKGFKVVHVFDVSQTEGDELPQFAAIDGDPGELIGRLELVIGQHDIALSYDYIPSGALGVSEAESIVIRPDLPPAERFAVLVHEFAHGLLHKGERRQDTTKTVRETEAEAVSFVVCQAIGLDCSTRSADYIQLYRGTTETLAESLEYIQKTATHILASIEADNSAHDVQAGVGHETA